MEKGKAVWNLVLILGLVLVAVIVFFLLKPKPAKPTKEVEAPVQIKESVLADFKEPNELQVTPYKTNNIEGKINLVNDFLELSYLNDQKKKRPFFFLFSDGKVYLQCKSSDFKSKNSIRNLLYCGCDS